MPWEKQFDKQAALDKALQAFWTRGYEATSMQELVDCTGVNRGSLYATYGDKRALFISALHMYDDARRRMLSEFEARYPPRDAIRRVFLSFMTGLTEDGSNRGCFITNTALELAAHDAEIRDIVATAQQDVEDFFKRMVKCGKAAGNIADHVKPADAARGLLASLLGFVVLVRSRPEPALLQGVLSDALRRLD
ncbi:TetR/AcrR family transcriptional regulator [Hyphomicrobium sp. NDB2Meth4]|uniref:TetR/AcrR family transcriptional regulator n=1 Tax=Hyphomicrobium sp. NDB2Meth4 TaxID=1892846 RepID=UPI0009302ADF|nr:TetR/AcrR family transcriptional regulator [Hyphomicrobium sp. NDB2Meth4]